MGDRSKLEPTLAALVDPAIPQRAPAGEVAQSSSPVHRRRRDLKASGLESRRCSPTPPTATRSPPAAFSWAELEALEAVPHVVSSKGTRTAPNELNHSVSEIHADVLHDANPAHARHRGGHRHHRRGMDFTHRSFRESERHHPHSRHLGSDRPTGNPRGAAASGRSLEHDAGRQCRREYTQARHRRHIATHREQQVPLPPGT